MKKIIVILLAIALVPACTSDDTEATINENGYLIFGHFYGECIGEQCVETFKLTNLSLFEDTIDDYNGQQLSFEQLDDDLFEKVKDLITFFPNRLLNEEEGFVGCPDCADGGGLFIVYKNNSTEKTWRIDQGKSNVPTYLHEFIDKVNEKISLIQQERE